MFCPDFKGKVVVLPCGDGEEGFNLTIRDNFRLPEREAMEAALPQGKGDLGALGDPDATASPNSTGRSMVISGYAERRNRMSRLLFLLWCRRWQGLGVPGGGAAAGGSSAGSKPADEKKRKGDASDTGGQKGPKLRRSRTAAIPQPKPAVTTGKNPGRTDFRVCHSPVFSEGGDVEVHKEGRRSPSIEVVTLPSVHAEDTVKKPSMQTIDDTVDSSNNLIDPHDAENRRGGQPKSPLAEKSKSHVAEKASRSTATGTGVKDQPTIQPGETELEFYYCSYAVDRGFDYHRSPWTFMQGDDISNNPSACRELLGGLGTPYETLWARSLPRGNQEEIARLRAEAEALVKAAREGAEQLEKR
ncbi:hypothetical protein Hdeb2414_s0020g00555561 [Helianthus debilis subsp. tardiflorus]